MNLPKLNNIAVELFNKGCIKIDTENLFTYASGKQGPCYVDIRQAISHEILFSRITHSLGEIIHRLDLYQNVGADLVLAGGETAGIPFAAAAAYHCLLPMVYIRKTAKTYGIADRIVGMDIKDRHVVLIEDLCNDGYSKLSFIKAIREAGGIINHCLTVFNYDYRGIDVLAQEGVKLHCLCNWSDVLQLPDIEPKTRTIIMDYLRTRDVTS